MKNKLLFSALALANFFVFTSALAQAPQFINYQAVARNSAGAVLQNQQITVRLTIHNNTPNGAISYIETDTVVTNGFGLFTIAIGKATTIPGGFSSIAWGSGNKYLEVEMDPAAGVNYSNMGTTQLLSVPYALYAENTRPLNQASVNYYASAGVTYILATDTVYASLPGLTQTITVPDGVTTIFQSTGHVGGQSYDCWSRAFIALYIDGVYIDQAICGVDVVTDANITSGGGNWQIIYPAQLSAGTHTFDLKVKGHIQNQCSMFIDDRGLGFSGHSTVNVTFLKN